MTRIEGGASTQLNTTFSNQVSAGQAHEVPLVSEQVQQQLFARAKPTVLDPAHFPQLWEALVILNKYRKKFAQMAGDKDDDYTIVLADGTLAMIDEGGTIYLGAGFLLSADPEVVLGALAHEIGHRPKRWKKYKTRKKLNKEELEELCRHEETRADIFAGKALAEMGIDCEPIIQFLHVIQDKPHPEYFPAADRGKVIREAHKNRAYVRGQRRKLFSDFDRMKSPKGHLGEY